MSIVHPFTHDKFIRLRRKTLRKDRPMKKLLVIALLLIGTTVQAKSIQLLGYDVNGKPMYGYSVDRTGLSKQLEDTYTDTSHYDLNVGNQPVQSNQQVYSTGSNYSYNPQPQQTKSIAKQAIMNTATSAIYGNYNPQSTVKNLGVQMLNSLMGGY